MFEKMIAKVVQPKSISWNTPKFIEYETADSEGKQLAEIKKGADVFLHKQIDLKPATSKEVYKKSESIWKQLLQHQLDKCLDNPDNRYRFSLDKETVVYLIDDYNNLVDVVDLYDEESVKEFKDKLEEFKLNISTSETTKKFYTEGKGDSIKLVCYDRNAVLPDEEFTPVVLLEFNSTKSEYDVYTGILIYSEFVFIPEICPVMELDSYADLVKSLDIPQILEKSKENSKKLYESYKVFSESECEISARELITLLKKVGYKLQLKTDDQLDTIDQLGDEVNNQKIQDFFNTFVLTTGETAYDILSMSELKKIFRFNQLTWFDVLKILSKEYLTYDGSKITCQLLAQIVYTILDKQTDKTQTTLLEEEINN